MRIRFTSRASRDLEQISNYYSEHSPAAVVEIFATLDRFFSHIQQMPSLGRETNVPSVRSLVVPRYPYKVFYRVAADTIEVITVFHTSQDPRKQ